MTRFAIAAIAAAFAIGAADDARAQSGYTPFGGYAYAPPPHLASGGHGYAPGYAAGGYPRPPIRSGNYVTNSYPTPMAPAQFATVTAPGRGYSDCVIDPYTRRATCGPRY